MYFKRLFDKSIPQKTGAEIHYGLDINQRVSIELQEHVIGFMNGKTLPWRQQQLGVRSRAKQTELADTYRHDIAIYSSEQLCRE